MNCSNPDVERLMNQGLTENEAYELDYLLYLKWHIRITQREEDRITELVRKKNGVKN